MDVVVQRFEVYWADLNPTIGREINKVRPCIIVSPNELNRTLDTVIIAPLTSTIRRYPSRVNVAVQGRSGQVCLDQIRSIDKERIGDKIGTISGDSQEEICNTLIEIFQL